MIIIKGGNYAKGGVGEGWGAGGQVEGSAPPHLSLALYTGAPLAPTRSRLGSAQGGSAPCIRGGIMIHTLLSRGSGEWGSRGRRPPTSDREKRHGAGHPPPPTPHQPLPPPCRPYPNDPPRKGNRARDAPPPPLLPTNRSPLSYSHHRHYPYPQLGVFPPGGNPPRGNAQRSDSREASVAERKRLSARKEGEEGGEEGGGGRWRA